MSFIQRALFTWATTLIFLVLLCFRLDSKISWSYFSIFTPFWIYDAVLIKCLIQDLNRGRQQFRIIDLLKVNQFYIYGILLKISSEVSICLKLDFNLTWLFVTMIPFWLLLILLIVFVSLNLLPNTRESRRLQRAPAFRFHIRNQPNN